MGHEDYDVLQRYVKLACERDLGNLKEWGSSSRRRRARSGKALTDRLGKFGWFATDAPRIFRMARAPVHGGARGVSGRETRGARLPRGKGGLCWPNFV